MKNRGLLNPFTRKAKELFRENLHCFLCGRNLSVGLEAHHILKRVSNSPLNLSPLCLICHSRGDIHWRDTEIQLLKRTMEYLISQGYVLQENDLEFINRYESYYQDLLREEVDNSLKSINKPT